VLVKRLKQGDGNDTGLKRDWWLVQAKEKLGFSETFHHHYWHNRHQIETKNITEIPGFS
jgi:hypothetical protein